jgi:hypothetical protein
MGNEQADRFFSSIEGDDEPEMGGPMLSLTATIVCVH